MLELTELVSTSPVLITGVDHDTQFYVMIHGDPLQIVMPVQQALQQGSKPSSQL